MESKTFHLPPSTQKVRLLPHVVCVEGNIGSGKSTLLKQLGKHGFKVIPEPVENIWGQHLPKLYQDLQRWGFCFQMEVVDWFRQLHWKTLKVDPLTERNPSCDVSLSDASSDTVGDCESEEEKCTDENQENIPPIVSSDLILVERSALSAFEIFSKNLKANGCMSDWEFSLLQRFYSMVDWEPKYILYLRSDPDVCMSRIHERNRDGENNVDPQLIQALHDRHEVLLCDSKKTTDTAAKSDTVPMRCSTLGCKGPQVIYVNGNESKQVVCSNTVQILKKLRKKLIVHGDIVSSVI